MPKWQLGDVMRKLTALIILDGWGIGDDYAGNAITKAKTPNYDLLIKKYPNTVLYCKSDMK